MGNPRALDEWKQQFVDQFSCESNRIVVRYSTLKFLLSEIHLSGVILLLARDLYGPSTVNDLIDAHSQINPSYLIKLGISEMTQHHSIYSVSCVINKVLRSVSCLM